MTQDQQEFFTPEHVDEQIDVSLKMSEDEPLAHPDYQLIQRLSNYYQPGEEVGLALKRVQLRLERARLPLSTSTQEQGRKRALLHEIHPGQFTSSDFKPRAKKRRRISRRLALWSVAAVLLLVIGGALGIIHQAHVPSGCSASTSPGLCSGDAPTPTQHTVQAPQLYAMTQNKLGANAYTLYRLDPVTGQELWHFSITPQQNKSGHALWTNAIVANGMLYFTGPSNTGKMMCVYAVNISDGSLRWTFPYDESYPGTLVVAHGLVYLAAYANQKPGSLVSLDTPMALIALVAATGQVRWQRNYPNQENGVRVIAASGDTLYAIEGSTLSALNAQTGAPIWQKQSSELPMVFYGTVANGVLCLLISPPTQRVSIDAYDTATGSKLWSTPVSTDVYEIQVEQHTLYAATSGGTSSSTQHIYALQLSTGAIFWRAPITGVAIDMQVFDGEVYALTQQAPNSYHTWQLSALRASDGKTLWARAIPGANAISRTLAIAGNAAYVSTGGSNTIQVFNRLNGMPVKTFTVGGSAPPSTGEMSVYSFS